MFKIASDEKIGKHLAELIEKNYKSTRQFGKAYLKIKGMPTDDDELRKMSNRLSQIKKGNQSIQIYDLPAFTHLLGVSAEEILSAGKEVAEIKDRMTNYLFAQTKDESVWEDYINRKDAVVLNSDEYGKTVLDYALEFKNYDLLKYLVDKNYIWFDSGNKSNYIMTFGAGTKIKRQEPYEFDHWTKELTEKDELRHKLILLAIQNKDFQMLQKLKAREKPEFYYMNRNVGNSVKIQPLSNKEEIIESIAKSDEDILKYFCEDFDVIGITNDRFTFVFSEINELAVFLIKNHHKSTDEVLKKCKAHNEKVYNKVMVLLHKTKQKYLENSFEHRGKEITNKKLQAEAEAESDAKEQIKNSSFFDENNNILNIQYPAYPFSRDMLTTNIIKVNCPANIKNIDLSSKKLIDGINRLYYEIKEKTGLTKE